MLEKQKIISDQKIINCLNFDYGLKVTTLAFLPLGADINASIYKALADNEACYFVKLKNGAHHDISVDVAILLNEAGIQQIISPINTTNGHSFQYIDNFTLIVYPYVDGQNGFNNNLTNDQ